MDWIFRLSALQGFASKIQTKKLVYSLAARKLLLGTNLEHVAFSRQADSTTAAFLKIFFEEMGKGYPY